MSDSRGETPRILDQKLVRWLLRRGLEGAMAAWATLLGLVWTNVAGLGDLLRNAETGWLALIMLAGSFAITGASASIAIAVDAKGRERAREDATERR